MAPTAQAVFIENDPTELAKVKAYFTQEVTHITLTALDSIAAAQDFLRAQPADAVIIAHSPENNAALDFLRYVQREAIPAVVIFLANENNYQIVKEAISNGASRTLMKGNGYWECLPAMIEQAIEHNQQRQAKQDTDPSIKQILDSLHEGIVLLDERSHITFANKCIQDVLGESSAQVVGQPVSKLAYGKYPLVKRYSAPIYRNDHQLAGYVEVYDDTRVTQSEEQISPEVEQELDRVRDRLMSRVSHEIKTPLTSVLGFAHMMLSRPDAPLDKREKWANFIHSKSELMNRLIDNMLDLDTIRVGQYKFNMASGDLNTLVKNAVGGMEAHAPDRQFNVEMPEQPAETIFDADRISQAFNNVLLYAHTVTPPEAFVDVKVSQANDAVLISVTDHGRGVPAEEYERVFQPFSSEPGSGHQPGKGLWLPLAQGVVEAHGGRMWLEGAPDGGNTFVISLPKR